ncbi:hypothetical protein M409DRAFT_49097 [Zasmidium cellare ATCC 36951]|uniref:Uncharacterized protein n=1 Tax=Zasmidium cellare ATCC 36951 TaxID=1080233 RepID=A0A6A6D717_ZASCE|nr:uncharacterized protein M409DRAFT_49097 [Zasmidium cellare ATCC 36951]KAF2174238.1 hypothetical protein M409DRAFT_49097 [Zasmidium cellare ATCC 36951]
MIKSRMFFLQSPEEIQHYNPAHRTETFYTDVESMMQSIPAPNHPPVAVPQVSAGPGMPFARCYSGCLMEHGISMGDFLQFIGDLNQASAADPTLQNVQIASAFAPLLQIPGGHLLKMGMKAGSKVGQKYITKSRGEHFLEEANRAYFRPKGLTVGFGHH